MLNTSLGEPIPGTGNLYVLMSSRGPIVIDWNNAHIGNPLEDVARSRLMLSGVAMTEPSLRPALDLFRIDNFWAAAGVNPAEYGRPELDRFVRSGACYKKQVSAKP
jgi:aminoglycoside phosphotransferase (APT) family kinase protein